MRRRGRRFWRGVATEAFARLRDPGANPLLDLLWDRAGEAMVAVDRTGRIACANAAARGLLAGAGPVGRGTPVVALFDPAARHGLGVEISDALRGRAQRGPFRALLAGAANGDAMVAVSVVALGRIGSAGAGVLLRLTDLRHLRQLEAQLSQAQKLQALGQLSAGVAHDFNNVLAAILGGAEAIADCSDLPPEVAEDAAQIRAAAKRGSQLVRQLLTFGRQQALQPRRVAVPGAIVELSSMLRRLLGGAIRLDLAVDDEVGEQFVLADPAQLDQVLVNLVVNARDAMPGGGRLRIESRAVTLRHPMATPTGAVPAGGWVTIDVCDNGVGIAPETLPRVFDPFFTTRREQGGSGLGLSTVHGIVRQSRGFLAIQSVCGEGTCVRVWLPSCDGATGARTPALAVSFVPGSGARTVLLVDDEAPVRRLAERALTRQGWRVVTADSADAALAALDAEPADAPPLAALVSDVVLPGVDGAALVRLVRARPGSGALPALLVSGYADVPGWAALAGEPATRFLAKPYTLAELISQVSALAGTPERDVKINALSNI